MCSWGYVWQSEVRLSPKRRPFLGGEERFGPVDPSVRRSSRLAPPPKESFQVLIFICLEVFLRGGTKSITMYWLALGMERRVSEAGLSGVTRLRSGCLGVCIRGPAVLYRSNLWLHSKLLPLLALQLLTPQWRDASVRVCLSSCIWQVEQGHRLQAYV